eukprot:CAMPEP_0172419758 /NCGR_PEP_ID=MMETSP1064-20121228/6148_1 /TAXON_ID=202472 /ORGANISM="Aulacoseira subarctica , Strain CCAP 1002/5" /LENGTH=574 /DNA_ID=CAMNT_0013159373 /DNA_START=172 /DNA_END=1893 /DNA_ORIENTATION=-
MDIESNERKQSAKKLATSFQADHKRTESLRWTDVNMVVKNRNDTKIVLDKVWGGANPGETTAIMGPSGAGKTALFSFLSGRVKSGRNIDISGDLRYGNCKIASLPGGVRAFHKRIAYVPQFDILHETSTPREALRFSARLRLARSVTNEEIEAIVDENLMHLGLVGCADFIIGEALSGGQRKRTSIGVELVTNPGIIFCDEPTSGLDSFVAEQLMELLDKVSKAGNVVIFTVHQPASDVFSKFDKLLLLNCGRVMYFGSLDEAVNTFEESGYPLPSKTNPADWLMKVAQVNTVEELESKGFFPKDERILSDGKAPLRLSYYNPDQIQAGGASMFTQLKLIFTRIVLQNKRAWGPFAANVGSQVIMGCMVGIPYYKIGLNIDSGDVKMLQYILKATGHVWIILLFGQAAIGLPVLATGRPLFMKEYFSDTYSILPYSFANFHVECLITIVAVMVLSLISYYMIDFPLAFIMFFIINFLIAENTLAIASLLGAIVDDPLVAIGLEMIATFPQILFTGLFVPIKFIPGWCYWFTRIMFFTYAGALGSIYMFGPCASAGDDACQQMLTNNYVIVENKW